ncbi:MAG TPA: cyclopropane-fatty-acyl-phospholipid synthase family protein [Thermoleophilaceae bacterium]|nr:cyclopropane-fatty-acyl-phospholipid synthase family protein [Thermoleophilaceae bacterium]
MVLLSDTGPLRRELAAAFPERPFSIEFWDGSVVPATDVDGGPMFSVRSPQALAHALRAPGQLGLGRAYVSGELEVDDLEAVLALLGEWNPPPLDRRAQARLALAAARACGLTPPPKPPASELQPRGRRHSRERDARAVRHHYDVSNEFFRLMLGDSMTYSCALWSRGASTLEEAQEAKLELVCQKLALEPGQRVLDVGCGWGSFAIHAAAKHGVHVVAITLSEPQAALARRRTSELGLGERVEIRVADYRELADPPFDAVASIGMVEHVGSAQIDVYAERVARMVKPGGRMLNHGISRLRHGEPEAGPFSERYVFPDAAPLHLSRIQFALERAGLATAHVEELEGDYVTTLEHWAQNVDERRDEALRLIGPERLRVWRLYLRVARNGFRSGFTSVYQVRCRRPRA